MPENPYNNLLFDHIDGFEYFLIFWVPNLSYLSLLQEGTTAEFLALGSSHNRTCYCLLYHFLLCRYNSSKFVSKSYYYAPSDLSSPIILLHHHAINRVLCSMMGLEMEDKLRNSSLWKFKTWDGCSVAEEVIL